MTGVAIISMIIGLCITWGGLGYAISVQSKATKNEKNK